MEIAICTRKNALTTRTGNHHIAWRVGLRRYVRIVPVCVVVVCRCLIGHRAARARGACLRLAFAAPYSSALALLATWAESRSVRLLWRHEHMDTVLVRSPSLEKSRRKATAHTRSTYARHGRHTTRATRRRLQGDGPKVRRLSAQKHALLMKTDTPFYYFLSVCKQQAMDLPIHHHRGQGGGAEPPRPQLDSLPRRHAAARPAAPSTGRDTDASAQPALGPAQRVQRPHLVAGLGRQQPTLQPDDRVLLCQGADVRAPGAHRLGLSPRHKSEAGEAIFYDTTNYCFRDGFYMPATAKASTPREKPTRHLLPAGRAAGRGGADRRPARRGARGLGAARAAAERKGARAAADEPAVADAEHGVERICGRCVCGDRCDQMDDRFGVEHSAACWTVATLIFTTRSCLRPRLHISSTRPPINRQK